MDADEYNLKLGTLVGNILCLEFVLRAFLINSEIASGRTFPQSVNLNKLKEGDIVPENAFTNNDSLRELINKYNMHPRISTSNLTLDKTLSDIRNAIGHGRISGDTPGVSSLHLLNFNHPKNKQVKVKFSAPLSREWFDRQISRFYDATLKVNNANDRLEGGSL